jgi:glycosyltransferase involved in cell wall biosynthesis
MYPSTIRISAVIIAKNEESRIAKCIDALSFCDEIIVIDNGSNDGTVRIAKQRNAVVYSFHGDDFAAIRNFAREKTHGQWLLYVDSDEMVSTELAKSILSATGPNKSDGPGSYVIVRKNFYFGNEWPSTENMLRLFRRDGFLGWTGRLHESANVKGKPGTLEGYLIHDTHRSLEEMVEKTNKWSETEADLRMEADHPPVTWWRLLRVMWTGFSTSYFRQQGWKAGTTGIIESMYQGFSMFVTYAKLYERQIERK